MEKSRRKFRTALFGVIAVVVAAAGGGWAVHFALSVQNNLTSATNGSVAIRDIQGSSVTYAGSGDIS